MDIIINYIKPELMILAVMLYVLGTVFKKSTVISNKNIPLLLGGIGIVLALIWVLSVSPMNTLQEFSAAAFTAIVQGILCAGSTVYINQLIKQSGKKE